MGAVLQRPGLQMHEAVRIRAYKPLSERAAGKACDLCYCKPASGVIAFWLWLAALTQLGLPAAARALK